MSVQTTISGCIFFDPSDHIYREHFPGNPVVPGSLIIQAFADVLKQGAYIEQVHSATHFRFKSFIKPGEYRYEIVPTETAFRCRLFYNDKIVVTGGIDR